AAVCVQLLAGADALEVGGDQRHVAGAVAGGEARGDLGGGGGLAGAGRADEGNYVVAAADIVDWFFAADGQHAREFGQHRGVHAGGVQRRVDLGRQGLRQRVV